MRLLLRVLLCAVLSAGLVASARAQDVPTMPVDQVREGMTGYGLTVLKGDKPQRFEFVVLGFQDHWHGIPKVIEVRVSGGPKDHDGAKVLAKTHIISGMSGSPMYINDKLVGALAFRPEFQTTSKGFITPFEYMAQMRSAVPDLQGGPTAFVPGDYYQTCLIWGDDDDCSSATITAVKDGLLYATGHEYDDYPNGSLGLPIWRSRVADVLEAQSSSMKMGNAVGGIVGTLAYNGRAGSIIVPGPGPTWFTSVITVDGGVPGRPPMVKRLYAPYYFKAPGELAKMVADMVLNNVDRNNQPYSVMTASVKLTGVPEPVSIVDHPQTGIVSLASLLASVIGNRVRDEPDPIEGVDVDVRVFKDQPLLTVRHMDVQSSPDESSQYVLLARRETDNKVVQTVTAGGGFTDDETDTPMVWLNGAQVQDWLLKEYNAKDVLPLLEKIRERRALYLVNLRNYKAALTTTATARDVWTEVAAPAVTIYDQLKPGVPIHLEDDLVFGMVVSAKEKVEGHPELQGNRVLIERMKLSAVLE